MDEQRRAARAAARAHLQPFGRHVRRLRRELDLTQDQLAEQAQVDVRVLRYIESGTRDVGVTTVFMVAAALGVQPAALMPDL